MDKYAKVKNIGEGAFGKALLVRDKKSNHQYVVKEIPIHKMKAREREDARKEVSVLAQMHHPYIVTYRESFEEKGYLHIVMDFCEKGDLYHKISSQRGILFPEDQVMDWFVQIALAIKYVHDRKILHRDIKTQNIFLTASGTVQLGDFGIAKVLGSTVELARTCIGTPYYLSPEICENRPYNNKSDIWSLGCVLYELTTLKHAFEAGNMKNLVLKIIRGSYPPISPKYSYDLRGLIAKLFKRTPRDRPSVNSILKMPFVQRKVPKFLTDEQIADEFSHTIMHGHKLGRPNKPPSPSPINRTPAPGQRPPSAVRRPLPPKPTPAAAPKKYNPANIYGAPLARKSNERSQNKRPGSGSGSRPQSAQDLQRKKQEFIDKERKRREEAQKAAIEKKHKDLMEKQKLNRINKAREDGWNNMIGALGSDDSGKSNDNNKGNQGQIKWPAPKPSEPQQQPNYKDRGDYADYHAYLDKLERDRQGRQNNPGGAAYMAAPRQAAVPRAGFSPRVPAATPMVHPQAEEFRQKGNDAAERARIVNEFIQRKKEAEANKRRGQAEMFGGAAPWEGARNVPSPSPARDDSRPSSARDDGRPSSADARRRDEEDYLERLKKIRQANYNDRRNDKYNEAEMRKKKIEALRQQADDKAKQLREQLERQRRELINKEDQIRGNQVQRYGQGRDRPGSAPNARPLPKPVPAVGITGVLQAIGSEPPQPEPVQSPPGIGMTGALMAIGAKEDTPVERPKSAIEIKKEEILKRVNQKGVRGEWDAPGEKPEFEIKEEEEPESSRSRWGEKIDDRLKDLPLQETASEMEVTSARDQVIMNPRDVAADPSRVVWRRPGSTIMNALNQLPILEGGSTMSSDKSDDSVPSSVASTETETKPAVGSTITISAAEEIELPKAEDLYGKPVIQSKSDSSVTSEPQTNQSEDKEPEKSCSDGQLSKPPVPTKPVLNKPPLPVKPTDIPVVFPKPTLLAKPDSPMVFGKQNQSPPKVVNVEGEGSLFSKVEFDPEESGDSSTQERDEDKDKVKVEEVKDDVPKDKNNKPLSGVAIALTTGHFDMKNTGLLRTCSEPDLSKLGKEEVIKEERRSLDLQRDDDDDQTEETGGTEDNEGDSGDKEDNGNNGDDENMEDDNDDDEDYEDLMSVRETMESLLLRECSTDDEHKNTGKFRLSAASKEDNIDEENDDKGNGSGDEKADNDETGDKGDNGDEDGDNGGENGDDNEDVLNNYAEALEDNEEEEYKDDSALFQSDESDADTQFGDDEDNYDLFSRLEESREELENQLGCEKFLKVYKAVQALQEDEDENIEDGARLAMNMLGKQHEHLYPKIFQLVMADAAFTEDNS